MQECRNMDEGNISPFLSRIDGMKREGKARIVFSMIQCTGIVHFIAKRMSKTKKKVAFLSVVSNHHVKRIVEMRIPCVSFLFFRCLSFSL